MSLLDRMVDPPEQSPEELRRNARLMTILSMAGFVAFVLGWVATTVAEAVSDDTDMARGLVLLGVIVALMHSQAAEARQRYQRAKERQGAA